MNQLGKLLLIIVTGLVFCNCEHNTGKIIGVKIYEYHGNYLTLTSRWKEMGINTCFISSGLAANDTFRLALKKDNIKAFIIFPVFQDPEAILLDSSLYAITDKGTKAKDEWVEFVCPSRKSYRNKKIAELSDLVQKLSPDGISIDFIRQFVFWEKIYPEREPETINRACFCDSCLAGFLKLQGITIPDTCLNTKQKSEWVIRNYSDSWNTYSCDLIASMVKELAEKARQPAPGLTINVHIVPWREEDFNRANIRVASQDLQKICRYVDYISPMCYSQMLKRDAGWIADVVTDMDKSAKGMVLPSIQVYPEYIDIPFTTSDFRKCLEEALKPPSLGVVFFSWPLFEKDPSRMEIVRKAVTGIGFGKNHIYELHK
jgi:hypothetical protein